MTIVIRCNV